MNMPPDNATQEEQLERDRADYYAHIQDQITKSFENLVLYGICVPCVPYDPTTAGMRIEGKFRTITFYVPIDEVQITDLPTKDIQP